jgi:NAD(P)-dependent dehydrogenase (short-subunit alcohol dehydrogenase family)
LFDIAGKTIIVPGGSGGLGAATARGLASCGAHLVMAERDTERMRRVVSRIQAAGVAHRVPATSVTLETFQRVHAVNAEAAMFLSQAAYPHLCESGKSSIVNVVSTGLWTSGPKSVLYRSSQASLHAMTMVLAHEWAPDGIRVNAVAPGAFNAGTGANLDDERAPARIARIPSSACAAGGDCSLASDVSSFVTATTLRVDGGAMSL